MRSVSWLASPQLEGRLAGVDGHREAALWAADRFRALGLRAGGGHGDFLQRFPVEANEIRRCRLELPGWPGEPLRAGIDYACRGFSGSGRVAGKVAFTGYGLSLAERGYDDYAGVDVQDRVVLIFKNAPSWTLDEEGWGEATLPRPRSHAAQRHGAVGLLMVQSPSVEWNPQPIGSVLHGHGDQPYELPQLQVHRPVADWLLEGSALDLPQLQESIDGAQAPDSRLLESEVVLDVLADYAAEAPTANVVGILRGADPQRRDEVLVVGAHLDHVGQQGAAPHYAGANDNASGSAAVLALAEAMARAEEPPARTIVFVLFSAEESGLHGAEAFVADPPVPLERVVAMLNLDCVGHGTGLRLGGGEASPELWGLARSLDLDGISTEHTWYGGGADAQPFFDAGIPTLYFVAEDSYTHLHKPGDTPDTLHPQLFVSITRLAQRVLASLAAGGYQREERPARDP